VSAPAALAPLAWLPACVMPLSFKELLVLREEFLEGRRRHEIEMAQHRRVFVVGRFADCLEHQLGTVRGSALNAAGLIRSVIVAS
jgi:hypothetical protein